MKARCVKVFGVSKLYAKKLCVHVCVKELSVKEWCVKELYVKELCVTKLCVCEKDCV